MTVLRSAVAALVSFPALLVAQSTSGGDSSLVRKVDEMIAPYTQIRAFRGTVLIADDGKVVLSRSYGGGAGGGSPREAATLVQSKYLIGSLTKTFTAAAIELLARKGSLSLDDSLAKFLPGFAYAGQVMIRQLLDHSSGIPDYYGFPEYAAKRQADVSPDEVLGFIASKSLDFPPGSKSSYSNSGYSVLAAIVHRVSGLGYEDFLAKNVFAPLRMGTSGDYSAHRVESDLVGGFDAGPLPTLLRTAPRGGLGWLEGNGSVFSTGRDMLRCAQAVRTDALVPTSSLPYPYGWGIRKRYGHDFWEDVGRIPQGYSSFVALEPHGKLTIIVLSDIQSQAVENIGTALEAIALGQRYEVSRVAPFLPLDSISGSRYAGRYEVFPGFVLSVRATNAGLELGGPDGAFLTLDYQGGDNFFFRPLFVPIKFRTDNSGRVSALLWAGTQESKRVD
jgi:CubicO group peptidase (beta-lactamase class C family)